MAGCGWQVAHNSAQLAQKIEDKVGCQDLQPFFWHALHDASLDEVAPDSWESLEEALRSRPALEGSRVLEIVKVLKETLGHDFWKLPKDEQIEQWAQIELKIDNRPGWDRMQKSLTDLFEAHAQSRSLVCDPPAPRPVSQTDPSAKGARWVMATAYQSCEAPRSPAMTAETKSAEGIRVTGRHPAGGQVRVISDLSLLQGTHPYLRIQNKDAGCFDVESRPLIYDFGGKPGYRSSGAREIDLFKNHGSGSRELGIDCSGLVFASLGVQGLRLIPNQDMTAGVTSGFGSSSLLNPPGAWKCLERIGVGPGQTLRVGDIITIQGHTVLVDEVGGDPWGLKFAAHRGQCAQLTEDHMDFTVVQSSPSKGAVGINRYVARDYLKESASMRRGVLKYARAQCQAHFDQKQSRPTWSDVTILRHRGTPECVGRALTLARESCVQRCSGLERP